MSEYKNENSFVLFTNNKKEKETQPDYNGKITLADGTELRLAAWLKTSASGNKFLSGKVSEFQDQEPTKKVEVKTATLEDLDGDLPF